ncbi:MAG: hypothetical protein ACSHW0_12710 [Thalassotalea sp.]
MNEWQTWLLTGNECYQKAQWLNAEYYYLAAEKQLYTLWQEQKNSVELLMAWICANHNLAAVYEQQDDRHVSLQYLLSPHKRMLKLSQNINSSTNDNNDEALTLMAIKALSITYPPIVAYRKKYTLCQDCYQALNDFNALKNRQAQLKARSH